MINRNVAPHGLALDHLRESQRPANRSVSSKLFTEIVFFVMTTNLSATICGVPTVVTAPEPFYCGCLHASFSHSQCSVQVWLSRFQFGLCWWARQQPGLLKRLTAKSAYLSHCWNNESAYAIHRFQSPLTNTLVIHQRCGLRFHFNHFSITQFTLFPHFSPMHCLFTVITECSLAPSLVLFDLQQLWVVLHDVEQDAVNVGPQLLVDFLLLHQGFLQLQTDREISVRC